MDVHSRKDEFETNTHGIEIPRGVFGSETKQIHAEPEVVAADEREGAQVEGVSGTSVVDEIEGEKGGWFAYFKTKQFYIVLVLG